MNAAAEHPREATLDALAVLMALDRADLESADAMLSSYERTGQAGDLISAIAAVALCAVRYSACASGQTPERLLAGVAMQVRGMEA